MVNSEKLLQRLRVTLSRPDTVLLIGSGISLWSGLPTWGRLLTELAEFVEELGRDATAVRQEIDAGDLLLAASYAVYQLDLREFGTFIRKTTNFPNAQPAEVHTLIASLGPSCFITTNYDRLLETAVAQFSAAGIPAVVTNRQVSEIADILPSYARRFVFKYHGDVEDAASIVLTRDQYRRIQHEYPATIRAFGTLLATRPVVMLGFGLRDLDFLALKDELAAAFEGQVGEYFAIMPDFDDLRADYWRKTYRTEIVTYDTVPNAKGGRDHKNLLALLRSITPPKEVINSAPPRLTVSSPSETTLRLARLAANVLRQKPKMVSDTLPLTVFGDSATTVDFEFYGSNLTSLLKSYKVSFLLLGAPGSGKSFALLDYAAELASELLQHCIQEEPISTLHVPLIANLAIYAGGIRELLQNALPTGLDLEFLVKTNRITIILDGANEAPREFIENGRLTEDFRSFANEFPEVRLIVGSRNETWISQLNLPRFYISDIKASFVIEHFSTLGRKEFKQNPELLKTLSKPLFFTLASTNRIKIDEVVTPVDVYASFFSLLDASWQSGGNKPINFAEALESVGLSMLESGAEFASKAQFMNAILASISEAEKSEDAIAFLLAEGALVALTGRRFSFFHQSITEYLASRIIAREFLQDEKSLRKRLADKRWDQALFLAMSFLDVSFRQRFLDVILTVDLAAAARAAHYLESDQQEVINEIVFRAASLEITNELSRLVVSSRINHQMALLPFTIGNVKALKELSHLNTSMGGMAAGALFRLLPENREEIIYDVVTAHDDWNYVQEFSRGAGPTWTEKDLRYLLQLLRNQPNKLNGSTKFGDILTRLITIDETLSWCGEYLQGENAARYSLISAFFHTDSRAARALLMDQIAKKNSEAIYSLHMNLKFYSKSLQDDELPASSAAASAIIDDLGSKNGRWALSLAKQLVEKHASWADEFKINEVMSADTQFRVSLILTSDSDLPKMVASNLNSLNRLGRKSIRLLGKLDFWKSAPDSIVMMALSTRNSMLSSAILEQIQGRELPFFDMQPIEWWLDWQTECLTSKEQSVWWCGYMIGKFINQGGVTRAVALTQFNDETKKDFKRIGRLVFSEGIFEVSTDELSDSALDRLLNDGDKFSAAILGNSATEEFVRTVLIPHWESHADHFWIFDAIKIAGDRHNRRYLLQ